MASKTQPVNVGLIGQGFMGKAHANAWSQVPHFFSTQPVNLHTVCGRNEKHLKEFASTWDFANRQTDWQAVIDDPEVNLIDVSTPNDTHAPISTAAIQAGKAVACEKPIAGTLAEARQMAQAAGKAKVPTFVWYNYRRVPAVALAHKLVQAGKIGQIRHVRGYYLQDWADESVPLAWRFRKDKAGSGAHGDLNAHIIDMTRFVTGEEITEITGAVAETFIKERPIMEGSAAGGIAAGLKKGAKKGKVTVDDCVLFLARFSGGAVAHFEAARQATGNQNKNGFEINGTKGSLIFNFERMNELTYYDATAPRATQGWTTILCTHAPDHPYVEAWWPDAHLIGYEHGFTNMAYDICRVLAGKKPVVPIPDFQDAYQTQRVLEAVLIAAKEKHPIQLKDVK
ncbi:MAG: Gfo/Idh/MocA family protein [Phycisphaerae bacterium]